MTHSQHIDRERQAVESAAQTLYHRLAGDLLRNDTWTDLDHAEREEWCEDVREVMNTYFEYRGTERS